MESIKKLSLSPENSYSSEEYFQRMLILERMKSQKTGKPFLLILLDVKKLTQGKKAEKAFVMRRLISVLDSSTRDIDIKGWYMIDSIIGIICQNIQKKQLKRITGRIKKTLFDKDVFHLTVDTNDAIKLLCFLYPD
jgi:hypothetical protein